MESRGRRLLLKVTIAEHSRLEHWERFEARMDALRHELVATMERGFRIQTWRLVTATFVAFGLFAALVRLT